MQATMSSGKFILYKPDNDWSNESVSEANSSVGALTGRSMQQRDHDYSGQLLRYVAEVWLSLPIAVFGIIGNIVAFIVLCHQRRFKLQIITVLLQVPAPLSKSMLKTVQVIKTLCRPKVTLTMSHCGSRCYCKGHFSPLQNFKLRCCIYRVGPKK